MRIKYLAAIAIAAVVAGTGLAVHSVGSLPPEKQSTPAAAQLATLLAESVDPFVQRNSKRIGGAASVMGASRPFGRAIGSSDSRPKLGRDDT